MTRRFVVAYLCILAAGSAEASTIYLAWGGNNAFGDIDGSAFADATWVMEYAVDTGAPSDSSGPVYGFPGAGSSGVLAINGVAYQLTGASASARIILGDSPNLEDVSLNSNDGFLQFVGGNNLIFPTAFGTAAALGSAVSGTMIFDSVPDGYGNSSILNFGSRFVCDYDPYYTCNLAPGLQYEGGGIGIYAEAPTGSGTWWFSVSDSSSFAAPVPLPAAAWLLLSGLAGLGILGRRRTAA